MCIVYVLYVRDNKESVADMKITFAIECQYTYLHIIIERNIKLLWKMTS